MSVLAILEAGHRISREALAAAQQLGAELGLPVTAAVIGDAGEYAGAALERAWSVEHALLRDYTPEGYTLAFRQLIERDKPRCVVLPHTYQVRDFLPKLATALGRVAVSDVISHRVDNGVPVFVRQLFQGKLNADVRPAGEPPWIVSVQAGAYRGDQVQSGSAPIEGFTPEIYAAQIRTRPLARFQEAQRAVDLGAAERIVSVGRGIQDADNIQLVKQLAEALGAELAASRPICDAGWLPMERQVGSSGQTVSPKLYLAVGISGAIQHLVGMKGSKTIVAINKDPEAPIFEVADYGIVGDLFQVLPALVAELKK